jgi:membrane-associated phospholipid phosphatase
MTSPTILDYLGQMSVSYFLIINLIISNIYKNNLFFFIIITYILSELLNIILKGIIQEPRPKNQIKFNNHQAGYYGMPSGHAQNAIFQSLILCYQLNNIYSYVFSAIVCIATFYQRYKYRRHTLSQIFLGGLTGLLFGYFCFDNLLPLMT